jgi:hypothetical protein
VALLVLTALVMGLAVTGLAAGLLLAGRPLEGGCAGAMGEDACARCEGVCPRRRVDPLAEVRTP